MKKSLLVIVAALAVAAFAKEPPEDGPHGRKNAPSEEAAPHQRPPHEAMPSVEPIVRAAVNPKVAEKVGLTEEQVAKLKALSDDRKEMRELHDRMRAGMTRQAELMKAETVDEAAVMAAVDDVWNVRKEIARRQAMRVIAVRKILTREQMKAAREAMREMRGAPRGPRGHRPKKPAK